jgi:integrase
VTIAGQDFYLGPFDSPESRDEYDRLIGEWLVNGRRAPVKAEAPSERLMVELADAYLEHIEETVRAADERLTSKSREACSLRRALGPVRRLYGRTPISAFGPLALKAVREEYLKMGWCRGYINEQVARIVRMVKWGVGNEMAPAHVLEALKAVPGLRRGKTAALEGRKVRPVADEMVDAIKPYVSRQVWAMVELMRITGARAGEVVIMRTGDIDTTGDLWEYRPAHHKTEHHGFERVIPLGARARKEVEPFLRPDLEAFIFSPAVAEAERMAELRADRLKAFREKHPWSKGTGIQPSQISRAKKRPKRKARNRYDVTTLGRAITRGCDLADKAAKDTLREKGLNVPEGRVVERWHPHMLRHAAATRLRKQYGIEVARVVLGHHSPAVTELYAEADRQRALQIAREVG